MTHRGRTATRLALALTLAALLALALSRCQGDGPPPPKPWIDGTTHGRWLSVFNGMGTNHGDDTSLSLSPWPPRTPAPPTRAWW